MQTIAPEVGAIVEYGWDDFRGKPRTYRVKSYLCRVTETPSFGDDWVSEILFDTCREFKGSRMRFCVRHDATHLLLTALCGAIAPIEECKVVGMVEWDEKTLSEDRARAERIGLKATMLF